MDVDNFEWYLKDANTKSLLIELSLHRTSDQGYELVGGVIRYKGKFWLGTYTEEAQQAMLVALHSSGLGGQLFYWGSGSTICAKMQCVPTGQE
jgi:hypothetical protein